MERAVRIDRGLSGTQLLAMSLPTAMFAGYDLARRSFLAAYLTYDLGLSIGAVGGLVMLAGLASIPAEMLAGALCDRGSRRLGPRVLWMACGTALLVAGGATVLLLGRSGALLPVALGLVALVVGWAVCNVTHGAWALEATRDGRSRARVFGLRTVAGIVGGVGFSLVGVLQAGRIPSPFAAILLIVSIGAPLAHAGLIALLPDRATPRPRWRHGTLVAPLRLLFASRGNRRLAALFALNGAHNAITGTGYLYLVGGALALPGWGPTGLLVQALCAAIGIGATIALGARVPATRMLAAVFWVNLLLAVALVALPPHRPALLMLWTALFGLVSAVDFLALRMLLGERLDLAARAGGDACAAAHYAGFHLPFNLCGALAAGLLLLGYRLLGFDPGAAPPSAQAFVAAQFLPAAAAALLMTASLWLVRSYASGDRIGRPAPPATAYGQNCAILNNCNFPVTDRP